MPVVRVAAAPATVVAAVGVVVPRRRRGHGRRGAGREAGGQVAGHLRARGGGGGAAAVGRGMAVFLCAGRAGDGAGSRYRAA